MFERKEIIVSCQMDTPNDSEGEIVKWMAVEAHLGGANFVRVCRPSNVEQVKQLGINAKIIGCTKGKYENGDVYITPTLQDVIDLFNAGADYVAVDFTMRDRDPEEMQKICCARSIIADVSKVEEGVTAGSAFNVSAIATTLFGHTKETAKFHDCGKYTPNILGASRIASHLSGVNVLVPVIAEGSFWNPSQVKTAFDLGVDAVCIGGAITKPKDITEYFYRGIE